MLFSQFVYEFMQTNMLYKKEHKGDTVLISVCTCGAVWLARGAYVSEVEGSNPSMCIFICF